MDTQDFDLMQQIVARNADMVHIGTDTGEIWRGWEELRETTAEQFEGLEYYEAQVRNLSVRVSRTGNVAWYAHLLDARIKSDGREEQRWQGARFTGVLEKKEGGGRWYRRTSPSRNQRGRKAGLHRHYRKATRRPFPAQTPSQIS
jgi:ketosteroid isomerase-like protein